MSGMFKQKNINVSSNNAFLSSIKSNNLYTCALFSDLSFLITVSKQISMYLILEFVYFGMKNDFRNITHHNDKTHTVFLKVSILKTMLKDLFKNIYKTNCRFSMYIL